MTSNWQNNDASLIKTIVLFELIKQTFHTKIDFYWEMANFRLALAYEKLVYSSRKLSYQRKYR